MKGVSLHHSEPETDSALYQRQHKAMRKARGRADAQACITCEGQACDWAWIHDTDPAVVDNYQPMCRFCHQTYDRAEWLVEERRRERERIEAGRSFRGWSPERREEQRQRMIRKWASPGAKEAQAMKIKSEQPWLARRPKKGM